MIANTSNCMNQCYVLVHMLVQQYICDVLLFMYNQHIEAYTKLFYITEMKWYNLMKYSISNAAIDLRLLEKQSIRYSIALL